MINDLFENKKSKSISSIKFEEGTKGYELIFKCACVNAEKILSEQEFKKAQVRKNVVKIFDLAIEAFETKNPTIYTELENFFSGINAKFEEIKGGSVPVVGKVEEVQQIDTLDNKQIKQAIITQEESIEEVSVGIQSKFTQVSSKKITKQLPRLKKDNK